MPRKKKLRNRHIKYVNEYMKDFHAGHAGLRAGFKSEAVGRTIKARADVQEEIERRLKKERERYQVNRDRVLRELAYIAFFDPRKFFNRDGTLKVLVDLEPEDAAVIAGMEILEEFEGRGESREFVGLTKRFKLANKEKALEMLGKYLGLFDKGYDDDPPPGTTEANPLHMRIAMDPGPLKDAIQRDRDRAGKS